MQYSNKLQSKPLPTMDSLVTKVETILDYEFESPSLCRDALVVSKKQARLANMASLPDFGGQDVLAKAAKDSGIASFFKVGKNGRVVSDEQLATTIKAFLGAIMEEMQDEEYVLRATFCLSLEAVEASQETVNISAAVDLLGVEELAFVQCARVSVPVVQSLI
ncbi:hypothetical protein N0V86_000419 [Didymella sp. IMI 355093]|nr:hypothetical protein N0V86_000419 [Didymella sp. IMI 355093]